MYDYWQGRPYDPLNSDYALYSQQVPVFRGWGGQLLEEPYCVSFITCAAVNFHRLPSDRHGEALPAMRSRIERVLTIGRRLAQLHQAEVFPSLFHRVVHGPQYIEDGLVAIGGHSHCLSVPQQAQDRLRGRECLPTTGRALNTQHGFLHTANDVHGRFDKIGLVGNQWAACGHLPNSARRRA